MKKTITIAMIAISLMAHAQTAGDELLKAKKHLYTGTAIAAAGIGFQFMAVQQDPTLKDSKPMVYLGYIAEAIGAVVILESFSHIGKAGKALNKAGIALYIQPDKLTLTYRF